MATREDIIQRLRGLQTSRNSQSQHLYDKPLRYILEFPDTPSSKDVKAKISAGLLIDAEVVRLSDAHGQNGATGDDALARFLAVTLPGIYSTDLGGSAFELGYAIADVTGAVTAEPELGTDFYAEPPGTRDPEGVDGVVPGCWVDQAQDPTAQHPEWALDKIHARAAWERPAPEGGRARGEGISVFQPDTGVADHVELEPGSTDMGRAYDFIANQSGATDPLDYDGNPGHGTGTASVVASRIAGRMAGAAPLATLVPLRCVERVVVFDHGRVAAGVEYARRNGAQVITMSLGGAWSSALRSAIDRAIQDGIVVLAAAGNCVRTVVWPARYEEVIAVAGSNILDQPWIGSCRGEAVDITAPGEFVPRANRAEENEGDAIDVRGGQGTSFAVALTAGVAALWLAFHGVPKIKASLRPGETVQGRFARLLRESSRQPPGFDTASFGAGIVDADALLLRELVVEPAPEAAASIEAFDSPSRAAESLHSLRTLISEAVPIDGRAAAESVATLPVLLDGPDARRYAAEISYLALRRRRDAAGPVREGVPMREAEMSPTLAERLRIARSQRSRPAP